MTVEQAPTQADPTGSTPIVFIATWSEPVNGFTNTDVTLGGTANLSGASVTVTPEPSNQRQVYTIRVSGVTSGSVIASIPANVVTNNFNTGNNASTSIDNSVTLNLDTTPPIVTPQITGPLGDNGWYRGTVRVTWALRDPESPITSATGCNVLQVTSDTPGVTSSCSATSSGGTNSQSVTVKVDVTPPNTTASTSVSGSTATVTLNASDGTSGIASTSYRVDGGPAQTYSGSFTVTGLGNHDVQFFSIDKAGNREIDKTVAFTLASPTSTSTSIPTATVIATSTSTATATPTSTSIATSTSTATSLTTETVVPTELSTETATATSTPTETATATSTPTATSLTTETVVPTDLSTSTPIATSTSTETVVPTALSTSTSTATSVPTATSTSTETATPTSTSTTTPVPPTSTSTATPTRTNTPITMPTVTNTPTNTPTATGTRTPSNSPTTTTTPTQTPIASKTATRTSTPTRTATASPSQTSFVSVADTYVQQHDPKKNFGTKQELIVDGTDDPREVYVRFAVSGVTKPLQKAVLRLYVTDGSKDGPRLYQAANSAWSESALTWQNRPGTTGPVLGNLGKVNDKVWVEYDVTALVTGNGTYNFVLIGDSTESVAFASREGSNKPQLVLTVQR